MVRVREDWRLEKRSRRTGKQSKADRDRKDYTFGLCLISWEGLYGKEINWGL